MKKVLGISFIADTQIGGEERVKTGSVLVCKKEQEVKSQSLPAPRMPSLQAFYGKSRNTLAHPPHPAHTTTHTSAYMLRSILVIPKYTAAGLS
ncbi:MAG: hypothetical protein CRN43_04170 [Candidatus Nephrothrix sp. EaCA]|nr:MAG: hypothetical protein CRN43_04170 [Candidatus Nephrothrix sp. EaCA]